ncbi:MAG: chemotaxis protein CheW [Bryobacteraceae bacterium]|jgi:purine-binding chemotaxis protein CheW
MQSTLAPFSASDTRAGKYLTFLLAKEEFGVGVLKVREIMGMQDVTALPLTPPYLKGVINLRGKITPVVDLRLKFGLPGIDTTERTCIIVVQVKGVSTPILIGIVVDEVSEVLTMAVADIEDTPDFGADVATDYILGMARIKGKVKILLDIDRVLTSREIQGIEAVIH